MSLGAVGAALLMLGMQSGTEVPYVPMPAPAAGASVCPEGICGVEALEGVFEALAATEAGERDRPVHILQIGDSHTAGDRITGALRARLQARFGAGGRGVLPPGVPYAGYGPMQVEVTARDWPIAVAPLTAPDGAATLRAGLSGARSDVGPGAVLTLTAEPGAAFDVVGLCGDGGPQAGRIRVTTPEETVEPDFHAMEAKPLCRTWRLAAPTQTVTLRPTGSVALHDVWIERSGPGVVMSSLGVVGAKLRDLAARDQAVVAVELEAWRPSLIILAFGVNDGFEGVEPEAYAGLLRGQIERLRRLAPEASLLILAAPEGLKSGMAGGCGADGSRAAPASLAVVRDVQRRVAGETGVAFWDWYGRMGGDCSAERLATMPEPYMRPDRVHFTSIGAEWIGGVLSDDLMRAYDRWTAAKGEAN
ncbi:GDSL-type esterase/lipase family protein [Brevundimonas sp. SL130]|uniref:GDSL-type esterase/lipase family protein n=1 Tax=Brevundimonas sp. SL130 TaxID=2995143 RepID=UPI00226C8A28|nr:GDSL-type esterase/lipase family protein [Brevundimonas sp. SL130]WAC59103.1 GDSL-type esterase/lipase family protein [Brevundimonas sp. SL130]